jgi:deazaflavin-dependent oxidoreductase (nitroreductase family)
MSDNSQAAAQLPKHKRLLRGARSGAILSALMLPAVQLSPPGGYGVITTTGRKTGKRRRKCVRIIRQGDHAYLVQLVPPHVAVTRPGAVSSWLLNTRANPRVLLHIQGGSFHGVAREITDPAEWEVARAALCDSVYPTDCAEAGLHLRGLPTRAKIEELHRYWFDSGHPLVVALDGQPAPEPCGFLPASERLRLPSPPVHPKEKSLRGGQIVCRLLPLRETHVADVTTPAPRAA